MAKVNPQEFGKMILRALNVDAKFVRGFSINVCVQEPVTITIDRFVDLAQDNSRIESIFRTVCMGRKLRSETFELHAVSDPASDG